jgi:hypothetical protein
VPCTSKAKCVAGHEVANGNKCIRHIQGAGGTEDIGAGNICIADAGYGANGKLDMCAVGLKS